MRPRRPLLRPTGLLLAAVALLVAVGGACTSEDDSQERDPVRDDDGQVLDSTEIEALRVQVGDCFNGAIPFAMESIDAVPCTELHDHEAYAVFDIDPTPPPAETTTTAGDGSSTTTSDETTTTTVDLDEPFPGDARVQELGERGCLVAFGEYVGTSYEVSALEIGLILPTQESWEAIGDREVVCSVHRADGAQLDRSVRGSGL
ncbi:hypothetical protein B7486_53195 [cyanobacterium TDX16]|nr:hypothetical protein B7486_53195 [cyanobacterium TDX16]